MRVFKSESLREILEDEKLMEEFSEDWKEYVKDEEKVSLLIKPILREAMSFMKSISLFPKMNRYMGFFWDDRS